jgi:hypothetical protein
MGENMEGSSVVDKTGDCRCDHLRAAHEHYRRGSDCSVADCTCVRFRRRWRATRTSLNDDVDQRLRVVVPLRADWSTAGDRSRVRVD